MLWRSIAAVIFLLFFAALAGCGGGEEAPAGSPTAPSTTAPSTTAPSTTAPSTTPLPTATLEPLACPPLTEPEEFPQVRAFAAEIEAALSSQDAQFFLDRAIEQEMTCTGKEEVGPCLGKEAGTVLKGITVGVWLTNQSILGTLDEFRQFLSEQLGTPGTPGRMLYALASATPGRFVAMLTVPTESVGAAKPSDAWLMFFDKADDGWDLIELLHVETAKINDWLSAEALSTAWQRCIYWERWRGSETPAGE